MRGADGISYVSQNQCIKTENSYNFIHLFNSLVTDGDTKITVKTKYPYDGYATVNIESDKDITVKLFIPDCMSDLRVNGSAAQTCDGWLTLTADGSAQFLIEFDIPLTVRKGADGLSKVYHGLLLLGCTDESRALPSLVYTGNGIYVSADGRSFEPVGRTVFKEEATVTDENIRILFEIG